MLVREQYVESLIVGITSSRTSPLVARVSLLV